MGGLSFDWKGKEYNIMMEAGFCLFDNDEEEKAFMQWRVKFISNKSLILCLL